MSCSVELSIKKFYNLGARSLAIVPKCKDLPECWLPIFVIGTKGHELTHG